MKSLSVSLFNVVIERSLWMSRFLLAISSNPALLCYGKMYTKWSISAKGSLRFLFGQIRSRFFETLRGVLLFLEFFVKKNTWARREGSRLAQISTSNMTFNQHPPPPQNDCTTSDFSQDRESEENGSKRMLCRWKLAFQIAFTHIWVDGQIQFESTSCGSRFFSYEKSISFRKYPSSCGVWGRGLSPWYWKCICLSVLRNKAKEDRVLHFLNRPCRVKE